MKHFLLFFVLIGAISCSVNELYDLTNGEPDKNPYSVSMADALTVASSFMAEKGITPTTRTEDISVSAAFSIHDKTDDPLFHVVNYYGGGFVIIAGDMRLKPIQAYSPTGSFDNNKESYPLGLKIWLDCAEASRENVIRQGEGPDDETALAWMQYKSTGFDLEKSSTRSLDPIIGPSQEEVDTLVGPLINDSWYQGSPYNDSLQTCTHYYPDGNTGQSKPVVGCAPLAIARVLRFNQKPYIYSWSSMPNNVPQTAETISFIRDVHYAVKAYADNNGYYFGYVYLPVYYMGYQIGYTPGTSVDSYFPIGTFLCNQYGYPTAITESYTSGAYGIIGREMIDHHLVCILSGYSPSSGGHAWVCDGYHFHSTPVFGSDGEFMGAFENKYLHHRWGWLNQSYDGWFQHYDYSPGNADFHYDMRLTHKIAEMDYWSLGF